MEISGSQQYHLCVGCDVLDRRCWTGTKGEKQTFLKLQRRMFDIEAVAKSKQALRK
jgi:hypothetical protein